MKVTIDIAERFTGVLSITAAKGVCGCAMNLVTYAVDLKQGTHIRIDRDGTVHQSHAADAGGQNQ